MVMVYSVIVGSLLTSIPNGKELTFGASLSGSIHKTTFGNATIKNIITFQKS